MVHPTPHPAHAPATDALPAALWDVVHAGTPRHVRAVEILEADTSAHIEPGDLILLVGAHDGARVLAFLEASRAAETAAGLVLHSRIGQDAAVIDHCRRHDLPLFTLSHQATWTALHTLLRSSLEATSREAPHDPYADLFDVADRIGALLDAPVTVEDAGSRVLAYSRGRQDVDVARTASIIGRRVPREVRDRLRALGVFRHLAHSDEPLYVPADAADMLPRFVMPVRTGGEWLGSVWAVVEGEVPHDRVAQVRVAVDVVALHLLRLRSQHELQHQLRLEELRGTLLGSRGHRASWLGPGPWRVVTLLGPTADLPLEDRASVWSTHLRRRGWSQPLVCDVEGHLHALLAAHGEAPGSWAWLVGVLGTPSARTAGLDAHAGALAGSPADLPDSRLQSVEVAAVAAGSLQRLEDQWAPVLLARAIRGLAGPPTGSATELLLAHDRAHATKYVPTLLAVLEHWGDLPAAGRALGVHPNTVRNRLPRLLAVCGLDLDDPQQRLAAWLECRRLS